MTEAELIEFIDKQVQAIAYEPCSISLSRRLRNIINTEEKFSEMFGMSVPEMHGLHVNMYVSAHHSNWAPDDVYVGIVKKVAKWVEGELWDADKATIKTTQKWRENTHSQQLSIVHIDGEYFLVHTAALNEAMKALECVIGARAGSSDNVQSRVWCWDTGWERVTNYDMQVVEKSSDRAVVVTPRTLFNREFAAGNLQYMETLNSRCIVSGVHAKNLIDTKQAYASFMPYTVVPNNVPSVMGWVAIDSFDINESTGVWSINGKFDQMPQKAVKVARLIMNGAVTDMNMTGQCLERLRRETDVVVASEHSGRMFQYVNVSGHACMHTINNNYYYVIPNPDLRMRFMQTAGQRPIKENHGRLKSVNMEEANKLYNPARNAVAVLRTDKMAPYTFSAEIETSVATFLKVSNARDVDCTRDGSVNGMEYRTGILHGDDGFNELRLILEDLAAKGAVVSPNDTSPGLHVHIGVPTEDNAYLSTLIMLSAMCERSVFAALPTSRRDNRYCMSCAKLFNTQWVSGIRNEIFQSMNLENDRDYLNFICRSVLKTITGGHSMDNEYNRKAVVRGSKPDWRYRWVNIANSYMLGCESHKPTVEFRCHEGTMDYTVIRNWVLMCIAFSHYAMRHSGEIKQDFFQYVMNEKALPAITIEQLVGRTYGEAGKKGPGIANELNAYFNERTTRFNGGVVNVPPSLGDILLQGVQGRGATTAVEPDIEAVVIDDGWQYEIGNLHQRQQIERLQAQQRAARVVRGIERVPVEDGPNPRPF